MVRIMEDAEGERLFYLCPNCGQALTYLPGVNGISETWHKDAFTEVRGEAVRKGYLDEEGRLIR